MSRRHPRISGLRKLRRDARRSPRIEQLEERIVLSLSGAYPGNIAQVEYQGTSYEAVAGQWIVRFDGLSGTANEQMQALRDRLGAAGVAGVSIDQALGLPGMFTIEAPPAISYDQLAGSLSGVGGYDYMTPDVIVSGSDLIPNDPLFGQQYGLNNTGQTIGSTPGVANADIDAPAAWDLTTGSSSVVVGVVDSGIDFTHPDLVSNIWTNPGEVPGNGLDDDGNGFVDDVHGWDFYQNDNNPTDENGHGTHVSGTIGAQGNNGLGVTGVNWDVTVMPLRFLGPGNSGPLSAAVAALNYATMMRKSGVNLKLTNNSWGGPAFQPLADAFAAERDAGILAVVAAGNSGQNIDASPTFPASYTFDNIITVAATDNRDLLASFSNYGATGVDLGAGVNVLSTVPTFVSPTGYAYFSGTSMATPHVTGVAALAWSLAPDASYQDVKAAILDSVDSIPSLAGITATGGRLNAYNTLQQFADFDVTAFPRPLDPVSPDGSLIHTGSARSLVNQPGDTDGFTLPLDPGQAISLAVDPTTPGLQPTLAVYGPDGSLLASNAAPAPGLGALLQAIALPAGGTITIVVGGAGGTTGGYAVQALLNAAFEQEGRGGPTNDDPAGAQPLDGTFVPLIDATGGARVDRGAVVGRIDQGATATVPGAYENATTFSGNAYPFWLSPFGVQSMRYQQIYSASEFAGGGTIDELRFRRADGTNAFTGSPIDVQIRLAYAATTVATASATFAQNIGAGLTTVYDGPLTLTSSGSGSPNPFDIVINVADLFHYDPSLGNLLVDITVRNSPAVGQYLATTPLGQQSSTTRIFSFDATATTGNVGVFGTNTAPYGLITQFGFASKSDTYSVNLRAGETLTAVATALNPGKQLTLDMLDTNGQVVASGIQSQELITNGSFETGDFTGWQVATTGSPFVPWQVVGAGQTTITGYGLQPTQPQDGSLVAWNGFDGAGPMQYTMSQDVSLPAGADLTLSWKDRLQWNFLSTSPQARLLEVQVTDPATNAVLATVYAFDTGTTPGYHDAGWQTHTADLSAFAGRAVRLVFVESIPQQFTGPGQVEFDAISLRTGGRPLTNVTDAIEHFVAPASGTYYLRVRGNSDTEYSLVATRNATFDLEPNNSPDSAQNLTGTHGALGAISATPVVDNTITFDELPAQPVDGLTVKGVTFDFKVNGVDSTAAFFGGNGPGTTTYTQDPSLEGPTSGVLTLDFAAPVSTLKFGFALSTTVTVPDATTVHLFDASSHEIGVFTVSATPGSNIFTSGLFDYSGATPVARAVVNFNSSLAGAFVVDNLQFTTSGQVDEDWYEIDVAGTGNVLNLSTTTPADGLGEFANGLDPAIALFDPDGNLVATGTPGADGRNESISYSPTVAGRVPRPRHRPGQHLRDVFPGDELQPGRDQRGRHLADRRGGRRDAHRHDPRPRRRRRLLDPRRLGRRQRGDLPLPGRDHRLHPLPPLPRRRPLGHAVRQRHHHPHRHGFARGHHDDRHQRHRHERRPVDRVGRDKRRDRRRGRRGGDRHRLRHLQRPGRPRHPLGRRQLGRWHVRARLRRLLRRLRHPRRQPPLCRGRHLHRDRHP